MRKNEKKTDPALAETAGTYVTLEKKSRTEFTERKSVFIGYAAHVENEEEAQAFVSGIRAEHADATHCVYAYVLGTNGVARASDDGEPQGTAGMPVLNAIRQSGAVDAAVVVVRYFGGILLGAPGLVRAYGKSARDAVAMAGVKSFEEYRQFLLELDYASHRRMEAELAKQKFHLMIDDVAFGETVKMRFAVRAPEADALRERIGVISGGRAIFEECGSRFDG